MRIIIGIATIKGREEQLQKAYDSLEGQYDYLHIYNNDIENVDYSDLAKFKPLEDYNEPIYFFSCDDDISYSKTYIKDTIEAIEKYNCIVTYHGRNLRGLDRDYYRGHIGYRCLGFHPHDIKVDVAGTGVTAFKTSIFNPTKLYKEPFKRMADLVFSLEAAKQGVDIMILKHEKGDFIDLQAPEETTCYFREKDDQSKQIAMANEIYKLKHS